METNETVEQVCEDISTRITELWDQDLGCMENGEVDEFANRFLAAHKREMSDLDAHIKALSLDIGAKDAEIERLKSIKREYINMQSNMAALRREVSLKKSQNISQGHQYRDEIASLRALVDELADAMDENPCRGCSSSHCHACQDYMQFRALVENAREVCK